MVTSAAVSAAVVKIVAAFTRFGRKRQAEVIEILPTRLAREFPEHTPEEIAKLVREEARREVMFRRKQRERLQRDLPRALQTLDPASASWRCRASSTASAATSRSGRRR